MAISSTQPPDLLYVKPLSHRICFGINHVGIAIQKNANLERWHGKVVVALAKGLVKTVHALNFLVAVVEVVVFPIFFLLFSISLVTHAVSRSKFKLPNFFEIRRSYTDNILYIFGIQGTFFKKNITLRNYSCNAFLNHYIHIHSVERDNALDELFFSKAPKIYQDVGEGLARDRSIKNVKILSKESLQQFAEKHSLYRKEEPVEISQMESYHQKIKWWRIFKTYLVHELHDNLNMEDGCFDELHDDRNSISHYFKIYDSSSAFNNDEIIHFEYLGNLIEKKYQNKLSDYLKNSFIEVYNYPNLAERLSNLQGTAGVDEGRRRLVTNKAKQELANFAQLQELGEEIECPEEFEDRDLSLFNKRKILLQNAKTLLETISSDERRILISKLLKIGAYDIRAQGLPLQRAELIQNLFNDIAALARHLYQEGLLNQKNIRVDCLGEANIRNAYIDVNLFYNANRDALDHIRSVN